MNSHNIHGDKLRSYIRQMTLKNEAPAEVLEPNHIKVIFEKKSAVIPLPNYHLQTIIDEKHLCEKLTRELLQLI